MSTAKNVTNSGVTVEVTSQRLISRLIWACLAFTVFLFLADAFINYAKWTDYGMVRRFFNTTREDALASWFAVTQSWMVGLTALGIYIVSVSAELTKRVRFSWLLIAVFFLYMSMDDGSEFHERVGSAFKQFLNGGEPPDDDLPPEPILGFFPSYAWQVVFVPIFGSIGLYMAWFLKSQLSRKNLIRVLVGFALFGCAVVLDFFEGMEIDDPKNIYGYIKESYDLRKYDVRHFSKSFEECFEIAGTTFIWSAFLSHLSGHFPEIRLKFLTRR